MKEYFAKLKYLFKWRDVLFAALMVAIVLVFAFCAADDLMEVTFGETALDVVTDKYTMNIPYDMVESIEIGVYDKDDDDIKGRDDMVLRTGHWVNEHWGEYYACLDLQTSKCILVHLKDGRLFVFSHKSDETVVAECETFQSHLDALKN